MASFPVRWWRAMLTLIQFKRDAAGDGWVEPSNEITRAILSGRAIMIAAPKQALAIAPAAELPGVEAAAGVAEEPVVAVEEAAVPALETDAEQPAADEPAAEKPARRRSGRAA